MSQRRKVRLLQEQHVGIEKDHPILVKALCAGEDLVPMGIAPRPCARRVDLAQGDAQFPKDRAVPVGHIGAVLRFDESV